MQFGGQGFGFGELGIALEEMGRALLCAPFFASAVFATEALLNGATESEQHALLPQIASGERIATLAWAEHDGRWETSSITLSATETRDGFVLNGTKNFVIDGHIADCIIVAGRIINSFGDDGVALFVVDAPCSGLERRLLETIDTTRKQAELTFNQVPARRLGHAGSGAAALRRTADHAAVALSCEMVGGARVLLENAVEYAGLRMQFGRPVGSFQAIKHKCADLLLDVELANAAACCAAAAIAEADPEVPALAALAKACASEAYLRAATEAIQIHGGIGFTWDQDTHLWFKRAQSSAVMLGDASYHREKYLQYVEAAV